MNKVNIFYPFDKGFFGKTLISPVKNNIKIAQSSKLEHDSIDDFNRHFAMRLFNSSLKKAPIVDTFAKESEASLSELCRNFNLF